MRDVPLHIWVVLWFAETQLPMRVHDHIQAVVLMIHGNGVAVSGDMLEVEGFLQMVLLAVVDSYEAFAHCVCGQKGFAEASSFNLPGIAFFHSRNIWLKIASSLNIFLFAYRESPSKVTFSVETVHQDQLLLGWRNPRLRVVHVGTMPFASPSKSDPFVGGVGPACSGIGV